MSTVVVDTNVAVVANGNADHVTDPACIVACINELTNVVENCRVVLDDGYRILDEYMKNLSLSGQPSMGDMFMKWVFDRQASTDHVEQVHITCRNGDEDFHEIPDDDDLQGFDPDDRKFVAVALTSDSAPTILNASDTDWWEYRHALEKHGCTIKFLCPYLMN